MADKTEMNDMNNTNDTNDMNNTNDTNDINDMNETTAHSHRKKKRGEKERRDLMNRLKRIEGQIRGLERMIDEDAYCPDILTQASAAGSALDSFSRTLLANHLRTCVTTDIRAGRDEAIDELIELLRKMM